MSAQFRDLFRLEPRPDRGGSDLGVEPLGDDATELPMPLDLGVTSQGEEMVAGIDALLAQIAQAYEQQARLIRGIGHDFKSPLSSLLHLSESLEGGDFGDLTEDQRECVHLIRRSAQLLMAQAQALYALGEARAGDTMVDRQPVDLSVALELVADVSAQRAAAKSISFQTSIPPNHLWVLASTGALERILDNAVNNAIKYTSEGSVHLGVNVRNGFACVEVSDTGIGIPADEIGRVGLDYARASNALDVDGTGVGLVVANHLLAAIGGDMKVESAVGCGTKITLMFPLTTCPDEDEVGEPGWGAS